MADRSTVNRAVSLSASRTTRVSRSRPVSPAGRHDALGDVSPVVLPHRDALVLDQGRPDLDSVARVGELNRAKSTRPRASPAARGAHRCREDGSDVARREVGAPEGGVAAASARRYGVTTVRVGRPVHTVHSVPNVCWDAASAGADGRPARLAERRTARRRTARRRRRGWPAPGGPNRGAHSLLTPRQL
jgi:hypothetical protein